MRSRSRWKWALVTLVVCALVWLSRPRAHSPETQPYFESLATLLASQAPRRPIVLIDLDRLDANLALVRSRIVPPLHLRITTWNGGGSRTYALYTPDAVVTDIALGGGLVRPASYTGFTMEGHQPALFIATPVLKRIEAARIPFLEGLSKLWSWWNPNRAVAFYVNGGGWAAEVVHPTGLIRNELLADPPNENLLPTLSLLNGSRLQTLSAGSWVFYRPRQGDAVFQFEEIHLVRGGRLAGTWHPFPRRY